ncbi:MAG TPA: ABC transporter ATP-binding protein [Polyangiaceae bacterium]|nr:ABC transporter ATP-binding protein [Polyangiaceae bacterium]
MGPITEVVMQRVSRHFGSTVALKGVDASFGAGQITSLEGPNGSGKSTLLGILGTILLPTRGEVVYGSKGVDPSEVRAQIGWLSHETHCYPDLTPRANLQLAASLYDVEVAAWEPAARRFGVSAFAERTFRRLSRGQRQRVALARAMIHAPSLLLLDEPTNGLDADGVERLVVAISEEAGRGCIVVLVTHDAALAERVAARRLYLDRGRLRDAPA